MSILSTFSAIEQVLLEVVAHSEKGATGRVSSGVNPVGTSNTTGQSPCDQSSVSARLVEGGGTNHSQSEWQQRAQ